MEVQELVRLRCAVGLLWVHKRLYLLTPALAEKLLEKGVCVLTGCAECCFRLSFVGSGGCVQCWPRTDKFIAAC